MRASTAENTNTIAFLRVIHGLIALIMIASIAAVYYATVAQTYGIWLYLSVGALLIEVIVVTWNRGNCPFTLLSKKYGDTKAFFELFLPKRVAKQMFKVNGTIMGIGFILLVCSMVV
jgi:hypothetical protein